MKNIIFTFLLFCGLVASSQTVLTVSDTLQGNETVNFSTIYSTGIYAAIGIDIDCTELGGTADGTLILQGRISDDASWSTLTADDFTYIDYLTNDTLTIVDAAVWKIEIHEPAFRQYRIQGAGTANDTTLVDIRYTYKQR